jgi:hypothetical protein
VHLAPKMRWTSILVFETLKTKCMTKKVVGVEESRGVGVVLCSQNVLSFCVTMALLPTNCNSQCNDATSAVFNIRAWNWDSFLVPRGEYLPCYLYVNHWLTSVVMCGWIYLFRHSPSYGMHVDGKPCEHDWLTMMMMMLMMMKQHRQTLGKQTWMAYSNSRQEEEIKSDYVTTSELFNMSSKEQHTAWIMVTLFTMIK